MTSEHMRYVIGGSLALTSILLRIPLTITCQQIIDEVNRQLPESEKIPAIGLSLNRGKALRAHRRLYPESLLRTRYYLWWTASVGVGILALLTLIRLK